MPLSLKLLGWKFFCSKGKPVINFLDDLLEDELLGLRFYCKYSLFSFLPYISNNFVGSRRTRVSQLLS